MSTDREQYEQDLARRQRQHLEIVRGGQQSAPWRPCAHDQCASCHGTGITAQGHACIHGIACTCPKCSPGGTA